MKNIIYLCLFVWTVSSSQVQSTPSCYASNTDRENFTQGYFFWADEDTMDEMEEVIIEFEMFVALFEGGALGDVNNFQISSTDEAAFSFADSLPESYSWLSDVDLVAFHGWLSLMYSQEKSHMLWNQTNDLYERLETVWIDPEIPGEALFFIFQDEKGKITFEPICDAAKKLKVFVDKGLEDDVRELFLKTQLCILEDLCKGECGGGKPELIQWLNELVMEFMDPMFLYLNEGNIKGLEWENTKKVIANNQAFYDAVNLAEGFGEYESGLRVLGKLFKHRGLKLKTAMEMANTHILFDLRKALNTSTVEWGNDKDVTWTCIGAVVSDCEKKYITPLEGDLSIFSGQYFENFNVSLLRDRVVKGVKDKLTRRK
ncbi:MAG: hypothetical protein H8E27_08370 [Verrucomicrobia subdivision 3 bacterium]|nr:hypothetical protein [Limisphaerales bacterium]